MTKFIPDHLLLLYTSGATIMVQSSQILELKLSILKPKEYAF